MITFEMAKKI
jgi:tryptophanyl-tRNA synthetase